MLKDTVAIDYQDVMAVAIDYRDVMVVVDSAGVGGIYGIWREHAP